MKYIYIIIGIVVIAGAFVLVAKRATAPAPITNSNVQQAVQETPSTGTQTAPTKYIDLLDWPPKLQVTNGPFACNEAGSEIATAGKTGLISVNGHQYCRTIEVEGAAGSTYTNYAYAYQAGDKVNILTFSTRTVQCGNYPEPEQSQCQSVERGFNVDQYLDSYVQSLR